MPAAPELARQLLHVHEAIRAEGHFGRPRIGLPEQQTDKLYLLEDAGFLLDAVFYASRDESELDDGQLVANLTDLSEAQRSRLISVDWGDSSEEVFPVDLELRAVDRKGLLHDVSGVFKDLGVNVQSQYSCADDTPVWGVGME